MWRNPGSTSVCEQRGATGEAALGRVTVWRDLRILDAVSAPSAPGVALILMRLLAMPPRTIRTRFWGLPAAYPTVPRRRPAPAFPPLAGERPRCAFRPPATRPGRAGVRPAASAGAARCWPLGPQADRLDPYQAGRCGRDSVEPHAAEATGRVAADLDRRRVRETHQHRTFLRPRLVFFPMQRPPVSEWAVVETRRAHLCGGLGYRFGRLASRTARTHPISTAFPGSCLGRTGVMKRPQYLLIFACQTKHTA
jgi:hypothetical protein